MLNYGSFCRDIVDNHEKENALNVVTDERTYHIYAESPEDARYTHAFHRNHQLIIAAL